MSLGKNLIKFLVILTAVAMLATGCAPAVTTASSGGTTAGTSAGTTGGTTAETTGGTTAASTESTAETTAGEPVTIQWATWEGAYMAREMAERFTKRYPNIIVEVHTAGWFAEAELTQWAAANTMPDVMEIVNPVEPVKNGWVLDLKPYIDAEENPQFYPNLIETGTINGKVVMIPTYIYLWGVIVNKDLLTANNIPIPDFDWTIEEFMNICVETTKGQTIGTNDIDVMMKHIPPQMNPDLGWGCWDGEKYDLSEEWIFAVDVCKQLVEKKVGIWKIHEQANLPDPWSFEAGAEQDAAIAEVKEFYVTNYGVESDYDIFLKGNAATWLDFSWSANFPGWYPETYGGWDYDFYPFPVVTEGTESRPGIVCDSYSISAGSANPDAAYEFLRYLAFSPDAYDDRVDIVDNYNKDDAMAKYPDLPADNFGDTVDFSHIPAVNDQAVRDQWAEYNKALPGIRYMMDRMDTGYVDGFKFVPAFDEAYHKTVEVAVREQVYTGQKTAADIADELSKKATEITQKAIEAMLANS